MRRFSRESKREVTTLHGGVRFTEAPTGLGVRRVNLLYLSGAYFESHHVGDSHGTDHLDLIASHIGMTLDQLARFLVCRRPVTRNSHPSVLSVGCSPAITSPEPSKTGAMQRVVVA